MEERRIIRTWGMVLILLLSIAVIAISQIFAPATIHSADTLTQSERQWAPSALTQEGLLLRADSWKEYPNYNIALGIIAAVSLAGSVYVCRTMFLLRKTNDG